jgi:hypothetical protein
MRRVRSATLSSGTSASAHGRSSKVRATLRLPGVVSAVAAPRVASGPTGAAEATPGTTKR